MPPSPERRSSASSLDDRESTATEETPLLRDLPENDAPKTSKRDDDRSLPKRQILLLCFARMMEPIAFFSIFPFIAQMVQRNGHLPASDVGFYSGLIESLFSATQMVVLVFWGRLADRVGRKPVLLCSLLGLAIGPVLFCMATSIPQMIVFRCLAGAFSGSDLTIRTMIAENSTPRTQAMAYSWYSIGGNLGLFVGPVIGGVLATPATQYPGLFGGVEFFERHPYALPGLATGTISAICAIIVALFLDETLPRDGVHHTKHPGEQQGPSRMPMRDIIRAPNVKLALSLYGHVMLLAYTFTAVLPVVLYTPARLGGLGFGPSRISLVMSVEAASQVAWLLLAFPVLQRRLGTKGVLRVCGIAYPFTLAAYVLLNYLLRQGSDAATVWFWIVLAVDTLIGPGVAMAFTAVQLALNDVAPSPRVLGTLNAVALMLASAIRAVAPAATTALYAVGVRDQIFWGHLIWAVLVPLAAALGVAVKWLPERREGRAPADGDRDADAP